VEVRCPGLLKCQIGKFEIEDKSIRAFEEFVYSEKLPPQLDAFSCLDLAVRKLSIYILQIAAELLLSVSI
jgi:hypothetical protein